MASDSTKLVGKLEFGIGILFATVLDVTFEVILQRHPLTHPDLLQRNMRSMLQIAVISLFAAYVGRTIFGRVASAGLPRYYSYLAFAVWIGATTVSVFWSRMWPFAVIIFGFLYVAGIAAPDKQGDGQFSASGMYRRAFPDRLLVRRISFLRSLVTIGCIALPLIWFRRDSGREMSELVPLLGCGILYLIWVFRVVGRFADSGRTSNWYWMPFCIAVSLIPALLLWSGLINSYETLALFLIIQAPLALLPTRGSGERFGANVSRSNGRSEYRSAAKRPIMLGRFSFLRVLLVIAAAFAALVYAGDNFAGRAVHWIVLLAELTLGLVWIMAVSGRFCDADWDHDWWVSQYCLAVSVICLMPLAVHWTNGYVAIAIFVAIQCPAVLARSKAQVDGGAPSQDFSETIS